MSLRSTHGSLENGRTIALSFRLIASVLAGTIAIALNMALLSSASAAGISTSHGGLFRLFTSIISSLGWSLRPIDSRSNLPLSSQAIFHILTGLAMAIAYALMIEPRLPGRAYFKGLAYGTVVWCINAFVVLPLTGEGLAGSRNLNTVGLIVFAVAHMSFFLALSVLYETLRTDRVSLRRRRVSATEIYPYRGERHHE
jgi:hypothetical protein